MTGPDVGDSPVPQVRMHPTDGRVAQLFHFRKLDDRAPGGPRWLCLTVPDPMRPRPTLEVLSNAAIADWLPMSPTQE